MNALWPAPVAPGPVDAVIEVPGSKSITNRALVLAALSEGPSTIRGGLIARDTALMMDALRALGVAFDISESDWRVQPGRLRGPADIDCGLAGTIMRFLPPVACLALGDVRLDGDARARERPMAPLLDSLAQLGARIEATGGGLPMVVHGEGGLRGGAATVDASASSQFVSGLLLSAARFQNGARLRARSPVPSMPHIAMTIEMLAEHGVDVRQSVDGEGGIAWDVPPGPVRPVDRVVEPDLSNALPFLAAAMATGGQVTVLRWPQRTSQPGGRLPHLLGEMGASTALAGDRLTVRGPAVLQGLDADLGEVGELTPVLAALAALAQSPSRLTGIGHLRGHETDRLAALAEELSALGGSVEELDDGLIIQPAPLHGGRFATYEDHRMATTAAVLGLVIEGIEVEDIATTAKTLPDFPAMWRDMLSGAVAR